MKTGSSRFSGHNSGNLPSTGRPGSTLILVAGLLCTLLFAGLFIFEPTLFQRLDLMNYDALLRHFPNNHVSGRVVIVDVDEKTLKHYGQWPWPRYRLAGLLDRIAVMKPSVVALDMVFGEPDRTSAARMLDDLGAFYKRRITVGGLTGELGDNDLVLAETLARGLFVVGNQFYFDGSGDSSQQCLLHPVKVSLLHNGGTRPESPGIPESTGVLCSLPVLSERAAASGFLNFSPDDDGMVRRLPLVIGHGGKVHASLALAAVLRLRGVDGLVLKEEGGALQSLNFAGSAVPVDEHGRLLVKFRGPKRTHAYVSAMEVMSGNVPPEKLQGKVVLVGTSAAGMGESLATPFGPTYPGIEVHAAVVDNLLKGDLISAPGWSKGLILLFILASGVSLSLLFRFKGPLPCLVATLVLVFGSWLAAQQLFFRSGLFLGTAFYMISVACSYFFLTALKHGQERRYAQDALRDSETRFRKLFAMAPIPLANISRDGRILEVNQNFTRVTGYTAEDLPTLDEAWNLSMPDPDVRDRITAQWREELERAIADNSGMRSFECPVMCKDGTWRTMVVATELMKDSVIVGFFDITERKRAEEESRQSEEKFMKIFMSAPYCIAISRMEDGLILDVNQAFEDTLGWRREEIIGARSTDRRYNFWANAEDRELMVGDLNAGREIVEREFQFSGSGGIQGTGIYSARPIGIAGEDCLIFIMQDITNRKRLEEDRQRLEHQLIQAQKMDAIGQLAGGVAHDFNNMLSVIIGNTELALSDISPDDPVREELQDVLAAGRRSADLTRQLLAFARKQIINPRVLDLNNTVAGILKMLRRLIGENVSLVWLPGQELWRVKIDPSQVDQLLANLTVNARDAINGTGKIIIETSNTVCDEPFFSAHPEFVPGEYVLLTVSDDGRGMEKETMASIFEPFFTTKEEGMGTGLGLSTVYGIVKQNGGFINVYSEPGQGTTFRIYLPRHKAEVLEAADDKVAMKVEGGHETVLIVEDEQSVLNLTRAMLEKLGYKVLAVKGAPQALRLAREYDGDIDLLFTDVVMPGMNGRELAAQIVVMRPGIRCLYMSGYAADAIAHKGILEEGIHFIAKPFSLRELAARIRVALGSKG